MSHLTCTPFVLHGALLWGFNSLRPRPNRRHFTDDILKCIFLNEDVWIPSTISLKFVPKSLINNNPALVQIMAWRRSGDKPLSEPMMVRLPTHICVTRPQWVNDGFYTYTLHLEAIIVMLHRGPNSFFLKHVASQSDFSKPITQKKENQHNIFGGLRSHSASMARCLGPLQDGHDWRSE